MTFSAYWETLTGNAHGSDWVELRHRHGTGMRSKFFAVGAGDRSVERVASRLGGRCDVYIGCALRAARRSGRADVSEAWTLWVECDQPGAREQLEAFQPAPTLMIASGTGANVHAYWALDEPVTNLDVLEDANRRLCHAVGGDPVCYDAARILRPPGTFNHKHEPARPVHEIQSRSERLQLRDVVGHLRLPEDATYPRPHREEREHADDLLDLSPIDYVERLLGVQVGRSGKVGCPFHEDRTPSLHVYDTPERGWYCFGCGRGGSIYDLAAGLWGLSTRGREFVALRELLLERLG